LIKRFSYENRPEGRGFAAKQAVSQNKMNHFILDKRYAPVRTAEKQALLLFRTILIFEDRPALAGQRPLLDKAA